MTQTAPTTRDFSRPRPRIVFTVDTEEFEACPAIPADILLEFSARYEDAANLKGLGSQYEALTSLLELVLLEDSHARLRGRLRDRQHPVDLDQLNDIVVWLMECYGARPTPLSPDSPDGPCDPALGTSSTAPALAAASTCAASPPTGS